MCVFKNVLCRQENRNRAIIIKPLSNYLFSPYWGNIGLVLFSFFWKSGGMDIFWKNNRLRQIIPGIFHISDISCSVRTGEIFVLFYFSFLFFARWVGEGGGGVWIFSGRTIYCAK